MAVRAGVPDASARRSHSSSKTSDRAVGRGAHCGIRRDLPTTGRVSKARLSLTSGLRAILAAAIAGAVADEPCRGLGAAVAARAAVRAGRRAARCWASRSAACGSPARSSRSCSRWRCSDRRRPPRWPSAARCVDAAVSRRSLDRSLVNVATFATFALVGGLAIHWLVGDFDPADRRPAVVRGRRALHVPRGQHAELPDGRGRRVVRLRRSGPRARPLVRHRAAVGVRDRPADRQRRLHLRPPRAWPRSAWPP